MSSQLPPEHGFVDETLTRSEREAPFRLRGAAGDPLRGPTRTYCEITDMDGVLVYADLDQWTGDVLQVGVLR